MNILPGSGSANSVKAVGSGAQQFGLAGGDSLAAGVQKGVPVMSLAAIYETIPDCLFSLENVKLSSPSDLIGKKVGVKFGSSTQAFYDAMIRKFHLAPGSVKEVAVGNGVDPLLTSAVDVLNGHADNEVIQVQSLGYRVNVLRYDSLGLSAYGMVLLTNRRLADSDPDLVKSFVQAVLQAWVLAYEDPEEAARATVEANPTLNYSTVLAQTKASLDFVVNDASKSKGLGWQDAEGWEKTLKTLQDAGVINGDIPVATLFTNAFVVARPSIDKP